MIGEIVTKYPEIFDEEDENSDWEQMTLVLALFYEMTLGKKSYWYPYLRQMPNCTFASQWDKSDFEMVQDDGIFDLLTEYNADIEQ